MQAAARTTRWRAPEGKQWRSARRPDQGSGSGSKKTEQQFSNSPDLTQAILDAVIDALDAHTAMSQQALDSAKVRDGLREVLLGPGEMYEGLRERAGREAAPV